MGKTIRLRAGDGHQFDAYLAEPEGKAKGGVVVVQEIFGVTKHIERIAEQYAAAGYKTIAPAMFDRVQRNVTLDYKDIEKGRELMQRLKWQITLTDIAAAVAAVRGTGKIGVVGFCWGGTVAHVAASDLAIDAAVSYYGGGVAKMLDKKPRCAIVYHFGDQDHAIPPADVDKIRSTYPASTVYVYAGAGHGFNCDERASYNAQHAKVALERSLAFLGEQLA